MNKEIFILLFACILALENQEIKKPCKGYKSNGSKCLCGFTKDNTFNECQNEEDSCIETFIKIIGSSLKCETPSPEYPAIFGICRAVQGCKCGKSLISRIKTSWGADKYVAFGRLCLPGTTTKNQAYSQSKQVDYQFQCNIGFLKRNWRRKKEM